MKQMILNWASRSMFIIFLVMLCLGAVQILLQRESTVFFDPNLFGMALGITFINVWFSEKEKKIETWSLLLLFTFLLIYLPKKIFDLLSVDQLSLSIPVYLLVLIILLGSFYLLNKLK